MSKLDVYHEKDDLTAFVILTDQNLEKLGVFFGHRRKMLRAIAALVAHGGAARGGDNVAH